MDTYRRVLSGDFCEYYDMLVGPDGFECLLTEPEDRNWYRDGRVVVDRLNDQHAELTALRAEVERLQGEKAQLLDALRELYDFSEPAISVKYQDRSVRAYEKAAAVLRKLEEQ